jgi:hypothetical protein
VIATIAPKFIKTAFTDRPAYQSDEFSVIGRRASAFAKDISNPAFVGCGERRDSRIEEVVGASSRCDRGLASFAPEQGFDLGLTRLPRC